MKEPYRLIASQEDPHGTPSPLFGFLHFGLDTVSARVCWAVTADSADTCADTTYVTYQDKIHLFKMKGTLPAQEGLVIKVTISNADGNKLTKSSFAMMKGNTDSNVSAKPEFTAFTEQRTESRSTPGTVLRDIANHVPRSFGYKYFHNDPVTWAHESTHGINAEIRNTLNKTGFGDAFADKVLFTDL